jgi:CheY-like chemotaxis protein
MKKFDHILLIDDSDIDNYINREVLEDAGICAQITVQVGARQAIDYLKSLTGAFPNVIFLDIRMPMMDGFDFLEEFEHLPAAQTIDCDVFMLSSSINPADLARARSFARVKDYLNKPLNNHQLEAIF